MTSIIQIIEISGINSSIKILSCYVHRKYVILNDKQFWQVNLCHNQSVHRKFRITVMKFKSRCLFTYEKTVKNGESWWTKQWGDQIFIPTYIANMEKSRYLNSGFFLVRTQVGLYQFWGASDQNCDETVHFIIPSWKPNVGSAYSRHRFLDQLFIF